MNRVLRPGLNQAALVLFAGKSIVRRTFQPLQSSPSDIPWCHSPETSQHQGRMELRVREVRNRIATPGQDHLKLVPNLGLFKQFSMASGEQARVHHIEDLILIHLAALITVQGVAFRVAGKKDLTKLLRAVSTLVSISLHRCHFSRKCTF
jgi:hypothetical protein